VGKEIRQVMLARKEDVRRARGGDTGSKPGLVIQGVHHHQVGHPDVGVLTVEPVHDAVHERAVFPAQHAHEGQLDHLGRRHGHESHKDSHQNHKDHAGHRLTPFVRCVHRTYR